MNVILRHIAGGLNVLTQLARHQGCLSYGLGDCSAYTFFLQNKESFDAAASRSAHLLPEKSWVLSALDETSRSSHGLRGHSGGFSPGETHGNGALDGSLKEQGVKGRPRAAQSRGGVHVSRGQIDDVTHALEDPGDQQLSLEGQGGHSSADDCHGLSDQGCSVAHGSDDSAAAVLLGVLGGDCAVQGNLQLLDRNAGADADEELAVQRLGHAGSAQDLLDHVGLAGQDDDLGLLDGREVLVAHNFEHGGVLPEGALDLLGSFGRPHAGDEARRQRARNVVCGRGGARLQRLGALHLDQGGEDAIEDGDSHGPYTRQI